MRPRPPLVLPPVDFVQDAPPRREQSGFGIAHPATRSCRSTRCGKCRSLLPFFPQATLPIYPRPTAPARAPPARTARKPAASSPLAGAHNAASSSFVVIEGRAGSFAKILTPKRGASAKETTTFWAPSPPRIACRVTPPCCAPSGRSLNPPCFGGRRGGGRWRGLGCDLRCGAGHTSSHFFAARNRDGSYSSPCVSDFGAPCRGKPCPSDGYRRPTPLRCRGLASGLGRRDFW